MFDDVYSVSDFIVGLVADVMVDPSGLVHTMFTVTGTSTAGLNSTVQVRVGEDPDMMGLDVSETSLIIGWGTVCTDQRYVQSRVDNNYACVDIIVATCCIQLTIKLSACLAQDARRVTQGDIAMF